MMYWQAYKTFWQSSCTVTARVVWWQASKERLEEVRRELQEIEEKLKPLTMRYAAEKRALDELRALQKKRDELKVKLAEAEHRMDLAMVADIKCAPHTAPPLTAVALSNFARLPPLDSFFGKKNS